MKPTLAKKLVAVDWILLPVEGSFKITRSKDMSEELWKECLQDIPATPARVQSDYAVIYKLDQFPFHSKHEVTNFIIELMEYYNTKAL